MLLSRLCGHKLLTHSAVGADQCCSVNAHGAFRGINTDLKEIDCKSGSTVEVKWFHSSFPTLKRVFYC